jgi:hypothetical protein
VQALCKNDRKAVEALVAKMTLFDDDLMSKVFERNLDATTLVLRIVLQNDNIRAISARGQSELINPNIGGRNIQLDILAEDENGKQYNIEVQRSNKGADVKRARYHSASLDVRMLSKGVPFNELNESYVIFITENDYFGRGKPLYEIERYIKDGYKQVNDGSHIIYINGSYVGDDSIGKLIHDFKCKQSKDMYYPELADGVRHFKEGGGNGVMCELVEKFGSECKIEGRIEGEIKATIETYNELGVELETVITKITKKFNLTEEAAKAAIKEYWK